MKMFKEEDDDDEEWKGW